MIKIPQEGKYSVPNNSDLFGNIWYTKNINLDEGGYIKLSPRMVALKSSKDDTNFGLPLAFGRINYVSFNSITDANAYQIAISETSATATQDLDTNVPTTTLDSHGIWYRNLWHATDDNDFFSKSGSTWTDRGNLTSGKAHPEEVFRNRDTLCIGNGNVVSQFDNTYSASTNLTLPTDYEVIGLKYSNYQMGIITVLSDDVSGQNQDAFFFVWDGTTTSASNGVPIGSEKAMGIAAYQGSWVILTRTGQLIFWTGGGFKELASLPFYYKSILFGASSSRDLYGDILQVDGDVIYINFNGLMRQHGDKFEQYLQNNPGGVLCYDPKIGIYHRYSPSISPISMLTVTSANIDTSTNILTKTAGTIPTTGCPIKYTSDKTNQIGGLKVGKVYFCIKLSSTTFSLAETKELAVSGVAIDLTSTGAANNYFMALEVYDYGATLGGNFGAVSLIGTENAACTDIISGSTLNDFSTTNQYKYLCFTVGGFENRGYFVTPKIKSSEIEDVIQNIYAKFRPLDTNDKIILKAKYKDILDLPVSTPQGTVSGVNQCTWTSANSFYTTANLGSAVTAFDDGEELECEIISGAGAGVLAKISDISHSSGTYVVTLSENIDGASSGRYCDIIIDNWKVLDTITSTDTLGYKKIPVSENSPWVKFKIELRGSDTTIEEFQSINKTHIQSI